MYIAGYIANKLKSKLTCQSCVKNLTREKELEYEINPAIYSYIKKLGRGGLKLPRHFLLEMLVIMLKS